MACCVLSNLSLNHASARDADISWEFLHHQNLNLLTFSFVVVENCARGLLILSDQSDCHMMLSTMSCACIGFVSSALKTQLSLFNNQAVSVPSDSLPIFGLLWLWSLDWLFFYCLSIGSTSLVDCMHLCILLVPYALCTAEILYVVQIM